MLCWENRFGYSYPKKMVYERNYSGVKYGVGEDDWFIKHSKGSYWVGI